MEPLSVVRLGGQHAGLEAAVRRLARPRVQELHDGGHHAAGRVHDGPRAGHHVVTDQLHPTWRHTHTPWIVGSEFHKCMNQSRLFFISPLNSVCECVCVCVYPCHGRP